MHRNLCGAAILLTPEGYPILHKRDYAPGIGQPGKLHVFGGSAEEGEDGWKAMIREVAEETGIGPHKTLNARFIGAFLEHVVDRETVNEVFVYAVPNIEPSEIDLREGAGIVVLQEFAISPDDNLTWLASSVLAQLGIEVAAAA